MTTATHALDAARYAYAGLAEHAPMSAGAAPIIATRAGAARILPGYLGPVLTVAGVRARDWTVDVVPALPVGRIRIHPATLNIAVAEVGDLELALLYAEHRRQAARALRAIVVDVALRSGLTDLRPFARPAGATR